MPKNKHPSTIAGRIILLPDNISADDIIAPDYLAFDLDDPAQRQLLAQYALIDVLAPSDALVGTDGKPRGDVILFAGRNFGFGSARPHGPVALAAAGVKVVMARSFSPAFARTAINLGCFHCLTPHDFDVPAPPQDAQAAIDWNQNPPILQGPGFSIPLADPGITRDIVESGGLLSHLAQSQSALP
jgi:3-isopropylmalate/(R)-2-methylmalate dehydratase small subunit